jgi:hypothetical protein
MTSPEDDLLEERLRRALSAVAGEIEPGSDGLDQIRARIGDRAPRPWLFSVLSGVVGRVRNWTWHGHWAWQDSLPGLGALRDWRPRRGSFPRWDISWLRLVTVLAGVGIIAGVTLGVEPVRQAIVQASTSLNGDGGPGRGDAGTEGNGTRADIGGGTPTGGGAPTASRAPTGNGQAGPGSTMTSSRKSPTPTPTPTSSAGCVASSLPVATGATPSPTGMTPEAAGTAVSAPVTSSPALPTHPSPTITNVSTCPMTQPARSRTLTPTASSSPPASSPSDVSSTPAATPTGAESDPQPRATPTPTATPTATAGPAAARDPHSRRQ